MVTIMDIEIVEYTEPGYKPIVDFESWRVAILNDIDELEVPNLKTMQKHTLSDEVFVLLKGSLTLFTAGCGDEVGKITATTLEPLKAYNVKKGVWHTHTLTPDSSVLIVENQNTCDDNSPTVYLTDAQIQELRATYTL